MQLIENNASKMLLFLIKQVNQYTLNVCEAFTSPLYTLTLTMQISHGPALIKLN